MSLPDPERAYDLEAIYDELRRLAAARMSREKPGHTLQPTALVHEAWLRLARQEEAGWSDRAGLLAAVANVMRRILVDRVRRQRRLRHGGDREREVLDEGLEGGELQGLGEVGLSGPDALLDLDDALGQLAEEDPRCARVVELRFFAGLTLEEIASLLELNERTVRRDWKLARLWLFERLGDRPS